MIFLPVAAVFLLTPLREGRPHRSRQRRKTTHNFYSRPCGRGDFYNVTVEELEVLFLLTPLREGRQIPGELIPPETDISTHAPAGGATEIPYSKATVVEKISTHAPAGGATVRLAAIGRRPLFLLTPLREGRPASSFVSCIRLTNFYSRPCGRGDVLVFGRNRADRISTHAPAGGATAIFHKSVMRFCGKLPKDDTVLCLASFGFPRRDPKAVYLAWISCANLPQKCVRQGLALKDQGTSCFHEGLASHAFDPVLV